MAHTPSSVALLRGINVGGKNMVSMAELAESFRGAGYDDVSTYIQSGNVLFTARTATGARLEKTIEGMLEQRFSLPIRVLVRSRDELADIVAAAPPDHGSDKLRSDVIFLKHPLTADEAFAQLPELREGVDAIARGPGVLYFSRVAAQATKTRIQRLMGMPLFRDMTVRNWRTTTRLLELLDGD